MIQQLDELVALLLPEQPVECSRPSKSAASLKQAIDRNYVHVLFLATGTELGVELYRPECDWQQADFDTGSGQVLLTGTLILNYNPVKCTARIDLSTGEGTGRLIPITEEAYNQTSYV